MKIRSIFVKNFKSFKEQELSFEDLTVLVGANASGKSNTISLFRFISNILSYGIDNAISLLGGIDYTVNASIGKTEAIHIKLRLDVDDEKWVRFINRKLGQALQISEIVSEFKILPNKRGQGYKISKDFMQITYKCVNIDPNKNKGADDRINYTQKKYLITFEKIKNRVSFITSDESDFNDHDLKIGLGIDFLVRLMNEDKKELIINKLEYWMPPIFSNNGFIRIYDFDPKLLKKSCSLTSVKSLEEDGSNLANVLQEIIKNKDSKRQLANLLSECLPFVEQISVENNFDKSISYKIKEKYNNKTFYANFLSDGTVSILALIVALYFDTTSGIVIIEEPERNMHPKLMSKIVEMAKETSNKKQVIITTHNPEFVKYSDIGSILFANRCEKGFTNINRPNNSQTVKTFLESELGIEDLFIQDILGE